MSCSKVAAGCARIRRLQSAGWLRVNLKWCCRQKGGQYAASSAAPEAQNGHGRCSNEAAVARLRANHRM
jgi:hypothetical protein